MTGQLDEGLSSGRKPSQHQPGRAAAGLIHWPDRFGRGVYATAARRQPVGLAGRRARGGSGDGSNRGERRTAAAAGRSQLEAAFAGFVGDDDERLARLWSGDAGPDSSVAVSRR